MKISLNRQATKDKIILAVQRVYQDAALNQDNLVCGIVKLYDLIGAYPIRVAELKDLTYRAAIKFLIAETGQTIPVPQNEDRPLAGFLYIYEYSGLFYGCILVKKNDPVARRRFTAAHELGHYLLHFLPLLEVERQETFPEALILTEGLVYSDLNKATDDIPAGQLMFTRSSTAGLYSFADDEITRMEQEANQFAAELLMPSSACHLLIEQYKHQFGTKRAVLARRLATEFLVSRAAMKWRLNDLNLP